MIKISCVLVCGLLVLAASTGLCVPFDERLWEKYADINVPSGYSRGNLVEIYLEPHQLGGGITKPPLADLRVITDQKEEVPWQILVERPDYRREELPAQMRNLSQNQEGNTWLELLIEKPQPKVSAVDINTPDTNFSRQVQVLGSSDGATWNILRKDGVIFDIPRGEKLRHTRITFPTSSFRHMALKINNGGAPALAINGVKVLQESDVQGQTYSVYGTTQQPEIKKAHQESSLVVRMNTVFPIERLVINTTERNFQRSVEVQVKGETGEWKPWAQGTIFRFNTATMNEEKLAIEMQEIAAGEFRLVFKNFDSPPLSVTSISGEGFRRLLVFKQQPDRKHYLFWGNPLAQMPQYDLAGLVVKQKMDEIPIAFLGKTYLNTKFAGSKARLPFTERYKYLLYIIFAVAIAGLLFLQYRIFRRMKP